MQTMSRQCRNHAVTADSDFSRHYSHRNGTAKLADREVPTKRRTWPLMENALQFHQDQEACKFAGKVTSIVGLCLVSC